jgi:hypothetical protein
MMMIGGHYLDSIDTRFFFKQFSVVLIRIAALVGTRWLILSIVSLNVFLSDVPSPGDTLVV